MTMFPWERIIELITLQDYNTRIVLAGTTALGAATGTVGSFLLLRKRSLMGDVVSHATLPGIGIAFILMTYCGGNGKFLPGLLCGAVLFGILGMGSVILLRKATRLKEDACLGIVLSTFFGLGTAILGIIQKMKTGHAAGLESFIYGKTASMVLDDALLIGGVSLISILICCLLYKEITLLCFDQDYAASQGYPVYTLDVLLMLLVVLVTVVGLQAVGLILIVALLIIPPATARFWTNHLGKMVLLASIFGAVSGCFGAILSALTPKLPTGAMIVLAASGLFSVSFIVGKNGGVWQHFSFHRKIRQKIGMQNLMRIMYEIIERKTPHSASFTALQYTTISWQTLLSARSWSPHFLQKIIRFAEREKLLFREGNHAYHFTEKGIKTAKNIVRNHKLWEIYLITQAGIASEHVDWAADQIEHVIGKDVVDRLEAILKNQSSG